MEPFHRDAGLSVGRLVVGPLENNVWVVECLSTGKAAIVDAADEPERILHAVDGLDVQMILTTHGHADHHGAAVAVSDALGIPFMIHPADAVMAGIEPFEPIEDGSAVAVGGVNLEAIHTPGHTPGSTCFRAGGLLFSGDTLFPGGPGATADPTRFDEIMNSLETRLFTLADTTRILPGHGAPSTIGTERPSLPEWHRRGY